MRKLLPGNCIACLGLPAGSLLFTTPCFLYSSLTKMSEKPRSHWQLEGLGATGPKPALKEELMLFGQFVGDWDIVESKYREEDGQQVIQTGELHWNWILEGRALQDVWMFRRGDSDKLVPSGTTVRFYDPERKVWRSTWINPGHHDVDLFLGRKIGSEIVLNMQEESKREGDGDIRWIFYDIKQNSFSWRAEESLDRGKTWVLRHEMKIKRHET
jgi:hypothetical protein